MLLPNIFVLNGPGSIMVTCPRLGLQLEFDREARLTIPGCSMPGPALLRHFH